MYVVYLPLNCVWMRRYLHVACEEANMCSECMNPSINPLWPAFLDFHSVYVYVLLCCTHTVKRWNNDHQYNRAHVLVAYRHWRVYTTLLHIPIVAVWAPEYHMKTRLTTTERLIHVTRHNTLAHVYTCTYSQCHMQWQRKDLWLMTIERHIHITGHNILHIYMYMYIRTYSSDMV